MTESETSATQSPSTSDKTVRRQLLEEAADLIDGDRNHTYGSPTENFKNIAEMWNIRFKHMLKKGESFKGSDVADAMILVKTARGIAQKTHDTYADIAGYAGCGEECRQDEQPKILTGGTISAHPISSNITANFGLGPGVTADQIRQELEHLRKRGR